MRSILTRLFAVTLLLTATAARGEEAARAVTSNPALAVIGQAADFALLDISGQAVKLSGYRGQVVLMAFIFTTCQGVCPIISRQMAAVQAALKARGLFGKRVSLLSVTVDPENDTVEALSEYATALAADPAGWRFLREEPERLRAVLATYDEWTVRLPKGELDHPARIYLIDQSGALREIYSLAFFDEHQALLDIEALLRERKP